MVGLSPCDTIFRCVNSEFKQEDSVGIRHLCGSPLAPQADSEHRRVRPGHFSGSDLDGHPTSSMPNDANAWKEVPDHPAAPRGGPEWGREASAGWGSSVARGSQLAYRR